MYWGKRIIESIPALVPSDFGWTLVKKCKREFKLSIKLHAYCLVNGTMQEASLSGSNRISRGRREGEGWVVNVSGLIFRLSSTSPSVSERIKKSQVLPEPWEKSQIAPNHGENPRVALSVLQLFASRN